MRSLLLLAFLCPFFIAAQIDPVYVAKSNLTYPRFEASGEGMFGFEKDEKFGYMDRNEKVIIPATFTYESPSYKSIPAFYKGYAKIKKDGKFGLIDKTGKVVVPFEYLSLNMTSVPGQVAASRLVGGSTLFGLLSTQNKVIIPLEYTDLLADSNLIIVKQDGKWGLFDYTGKKLLPAEYTALTPYSREKVLKVEKDGKFGFTDITGKWLFEKSKSVFTLYSAVNGMILCAISNKYGYLDLSGEEVVITKYDYGAGFESNGLAKVGRKSPTSTYTTIYGYIDKKGTEIIPIKYATMGAFSNGLVYVKDPETNRYGYMDKTGKWALKAVYLEAGSFDAFGGAWVKMTDGKNHYINKAGKDFGAVEGSYRNFNADGYAVIEHSDYPYALIDKNGSVIKKIDDADAVYTFSQGIAGYKCKTTAKYGFIDVNGKIIKSCSYDGFAGFSDGIARVETKVAGKTKYGYLNDKGETIVPIEYESMQLFRNGWGVLKKDGLNYFVDKAGNLRETPRKYDALTEFRSGYAIGTVNGTDLNTYYYINTQLQEELVVSAKNAWQFWDDVAIVNRTGVYEMMNKKGEFFKKLDGVQEMKFATDGLMWVKSGGKWGVLDTKGNTVVASRYDSCDQFKYGYGRIKMGSKWGIIDKTGKEIIAPTYENILPGENGIFVFLDKFWGVIDKTGKIIVPPGYYSLTPFEKDRALARLGKTYSILKSPLVK